MKFLLRVDGVPDSRLHELVDGKQQIGSSPTCTIRLDHPEIEGVAAGVEVSSGVVFFNNQSPFAVYVGTTEVAPAGTTEWRPGNEVLLTRSVKLHLEATDAGIAQDTGPAKKQSSPTQTLVQAAITGVCLLLSVWMLTSESDSTQSEDSTVIRFDELIAKYEEVGKTKLASLSYRQRVLLGYLTEARTLETRWGNEKSDETLGAYELVLSTSMNMDDALSDSTREYAASRIELLR